MKIYLCKVLSPSGARLLSTTLQNFKALQFLLKSKGFLVRSLPLAGVGGWKTLNLGKFHPSIPASGEDCILQIKYIREEFIILALVKKNLTTTDSILGKV